MQVFIDESGDTGFKFDKGSSRYFVIVAVVFDDYNEIDKLDKIILDFKNKLGFGRDVEIKFNKSSISIKQKFLNKINTGKFIILSLIVDKSKINTKYLDYDDMVRILLIDSYIFNAKIKIDGNASSIFKKKFKSILKRNLNTHEKKIIKDVAFINSKNNNIIQMADMIAGSIRKSYEGNDKMEKIIKKHIKIKKLIS